MLWKYRKSLPFIISLALNMGLQIAGVEIKWLGYLLIAIAILGVIYFIYSLIKEKRLSQEQSNQANLVIERPQASTSNVLHIERQEPSNLPPFWIVLIGILAFLLLLAFGVFQTYLVVSGIVVAKFNLEWIVFYLLFVVFPIWVLLDILVFDRKHYKSGRSATAIDVTFIVKGDITDVFNRCSNILETMKTKLIRKDTPNLIKAHLSKSRLFIEVSPQDDNVKVYVLSDAIWVTVMVGRGRNQRIIDEFQKHFLEESRVSKAVSSEQRKEAIHIADIYEDNKRECGLIVHNSSNNILKNCHARLLDLAFEIPHPRFSLKRYPKSEDLVCSQEIPEFGDGKVPLFRWGADTASKNLEIIYHSGTQQIGYRILAVPILVLISLWADDVPATYAICKLSDRLGWGYELSILKTGLQQDRIEIATFQLSNPDKEDSPTG